MKRCGWCKQRVWPWQRSRKVGRAGRIHIRCLAAINQMVLRDEEVHGV